MPGHLFQHPSPGVAQPLAIGLCLWLLLLLAAWCFWPAITGPFVFDDFPNLQNLEQLGGHVNRDTVGYYLYAFLDNPGRPLAALSFLIEDSTWPAFPAAFKRDNILFHLLAGCCVFWLALRLASQRDRTAGKAPLIALACTAMWLLHPMQLSATMLVVQRMNILSTIWMLVGLLGYLKALDAMRLSEFTRVALAGVSLATFGSLAFLCKENGVLIFAYASVLNLTLLRKQLLALRPGNRRLLIWGAASPMLLLAGLTLSHFGGVLRDYDLRDFSLAQRLLTEPRILFDYLGTILLPRLSGQGIFHDDYVISRSLLDPPATAFALAGIIALIGSALWLRRRCPLYSFAVFWFFAGHLIESTVVALELYFEHRNYLPMLGPLFALASALLTVRPAWQKATTLVLAVWLGTAAMSTVYNAGVWGDRGKLALVWAQQSPRSVRAVQMLASYHADSGDIVQARRTLDAGIARLPAHDELKFQRVLLDCIDRGLAHGQWQELMDVAASSRYSRGIPDLVSSFVEQVEGTRCHGTLTTNDVRQLTEVLLANGNFGHDHDTQGYLHYELAKLALAEHDLDAMMHEMDLSSAFRPNPLVPREQAIYLLTAGLPDAALTYLDRSDNTPQPWFKSWLLNIKEKNQPLRRSAAKMRIVLGQQAKLRDPRQQLPEH